jgi:cytidylate kinase
MTSRTTVTIARKMGSGGAYVGQIVADRLGLRFVDREVLRMAADALGVGDEEVEATRDRLDSFWERFFGGLRFGTPEAAYTPPPVRRFTDEELFRRQVDALRVIARETDCVILGYGGAFVLPRHPRMVNIYLHAPFEARVRRVREIYGIADEAEARRTVEESDAMRKKYFLQMTGRDWACADNYDLCLDTGLYPLAELGERLVAFVERRLSRAPETGRG